MQKAEGAKAVKKAEGEKTVKKAEGAKAVKKAQGAKITVQKAEGEKRARTVRTEREKMRHRFTSDAWHDAYKLACENGKPEDEAKAAARDARENCMASNGGRVRRREVFGARPACRRLLL